MLTIERFFFFKLTLNQKKKKNKNQKFHLTWKNFKGNTLSVNAPNVKKEIFTDNLVSPPLVGPMKHLSKNRERDSSGEQV